MILSEMQIENMRIACKVVRDLHLELEHMCKVGVKLKDLDSYAEMYIRSHNCKPNFKNYGGFPGSVCISLNDEVVHGKPDNRIIQNGDVVKFDLGCSYNGIHADAARTVLVGDVSENARKLAEVTKQSFFEGIKGLKAGCSLNQIGYNVEKYVNRFGFSVVRDMCGHGIGTKLHMSPEVLNYDSPRSSRVILKANEALAIEPMVNEFGYDLTVLITDEGVEILTL